MSRKVIELVQVLVDRIEKNGYQQRAREENAFDLNKRLTEAEGWVAHWKQARQEAHEAGELMKAEIETLRKELDEERSVNAGLREQLDAAHADYELAQAGTLLHQLDAANAAVSLQRAGIERLQAFVAKARQTIGRTMNFCDVEFLLNALAELDAGTEPTPVAEPLDAEGVK
jgi:chromosome segregation ATPase